LPHWESANGIYFVTFRLADSMPQQVLRQLRQDALGKVQGTKDFSERLESYLDSGVGSCYLKEFGVAEIVAGSLAQFDGARYNLLAWCIMPNHVHVVFQLRDGNLLHTVVHGWKSYTSLQINRHLSRRGALWQREYYDHLLRGGDQLQRAIRYTAENPRLAGLNNWQYVYVSAQASGGPAKTNVSC
jgi:hypothetical protein